MFKSNTIYALKPSKVFKHSQENKTFMNLIGNLPFVISSFSDAENTIVKKVCTLHEGTIFDVGNLEFSDDFIIIGGRSPEKRIRVLIKKFEGGEVLSDTEVFILYDYFRQLSALVQVNPDLNSTRFYTFMNEAKLNDIIRARFME